MEYSFNFKSIGIHLSFNIPVLDKDKGCEENLKQVLDEILFVVDRKIQFKLTKIHEGV